MNWENMEPDNKKIQNLKKSLRDIENEKQNGNPWDFIIIVIITIVLAFKCLQII